MNNPIILPPLTREELEILIALLKGYTVTETANQLYGGRENIVETHTRNIRGKASCKNLAVAAFRFMHLNMIPAELLKEAFEQGRY